MGRTQIYLTDEELTLLDEQARATGASRSALIRRAVQTAYGSAQKRLPIASIGVVSVGGFDSDRLDEELGEILEEKFGRQR
ncbi:MAG TPA: CopG family transcriptional regulator [Gaiellaceae bacterium]